MGKLLERKLADWEARLLPPRPNATERDEHVRYEELLRAGYVVVWDGERLTELAKLGVVFARVRPDGARWPLQRAAHDGHAYLAAEGDVAMFEALTRAMNMGEHARSGAELRQAVDTLVMTLQEKRPLSVDELAALEAIVRLGDARSVRLWLSSLQ